MFVSVSLVLYYRLQGTDSDSDEVVEVMDDVSIDESEEEVISYASTDSEDSDELEEQQNNRLLTAEGMSSIRRKFGNILTLRMEVQKQEPKGVNILQPPSLQDENVHNLPSSPIKLKKYFGSTARRDFYDKMSTAYQEEDIKGAMLKNAFDQTAFIPSREDVDVPFMPRRPPKKSDSTKKKIEIDSLGDISCLDECDDRPCLRIDAPSTLSSFDYLQAYDYEKNQPTSPRTTFISGCIQKNIPPRASLLLRKNISKELNLQHQGKFAGVRCGRNR